MGLLESVKDHVVCGLKSFPVVAVLSEKKSMCIYW